MADRTAIVTGASAGIGAATARLLLERGWRVVATARRADRLEAIRGAIPVAGDITDDGTRRRILEAAGGRTDLLVNNAGYGEAGPVESVPPDRARRQMEINFFAVAEMCRAVLPLMRAQRSGRIVQVSSVAGRVGYPLFGWYCASKHALEGLSDAMRSELRPFGVQVVLVEPGPVATEFAGVAKREAGALVEDAKSPYRALMERTAEIEKRFFGRATTPEAVAAVILRAATARSPRPRYAVHPMARSTLLALRLLPFSWVDALVRREFLVPKRLP
jgi:NAD(P)-dependent dehydrogenase (short-subunit alcohol dehydrogenase family)